MTANTVQPKLVLGNFPFTIQHILSDNLALDSNEYYDLYTTLQFCSDPDDYINEDEEEDSEYINDDVTTN